VIEESAALHVSFYRGAEREGDVTLEPAVDRCIIRALDKGLRLGDTRLELFDGRLGVLEFRRLVCIWRVSANMSGVSR
jgi:hypothetical protein